MSEFRKLPDYFITQAEALCDQLIFRIQPSINLSGVKDNISSSTSSHNFIKYPKNDLESAYLELLHAIKEYLKLVSKIEEQLAGGLYTAYSQIPRIRELLSLKIENSPNASCRIYA
ncbi:unnamed protein product [Fusarium fujikuroi]|nr:unnamed protein product [Fusarium fujikuroi]